MRRSPAFNYTAPEIGLTLDGRPLAARPGQSVAAALMADGVSAWRTTRFSGRPRGLFCGIGVCFDCLLTIDGERNQRACLVEATEGMAVERQRPESLKVTVREDTEQAQA